MTDLCEPVVLSEDFVTEVARIQELAPNLYRVIICSSERSVTYDEQERVVKAKLLMTGESMRAISMALAAGASFNPAFAALSPTTVAN